MVILDRFGDQTIKLVSFDIDETITRWKDVRGFLQNALYYLNMPYKEEYLNGLYLAMKNRELCSIVSGLWFVETYDLLLEEFIPDLRMYGKTGKDLRTIMYEMEPEETYINDDVKSELEELAQLYKLVGYTGWDLDPATRKLEKYDLAKYFETIYTPKDLRTKNTKVGFIILASMQHLSPHHIAHVGDSHTEISSAKGAGCAAIYIDYNIKDGDDITKERMETILAADAAVNEFSDIRRVLTRYKKY